MDLPALEPAGPVESELFDAGLPSEEGVLDEAKMEELNSKLALAYCDSGADGVPPPEPLPQEPMVKEDFQKAFHRSFSAWSDDDKGSMIAHVIGKQVSSTSTRTSSRQRTMAFTSDLAPLAEVPDAAPAERSVSSPDMWEGIGSAMSGALDFVLALVSEATQQLADHLPECGDECAVEETRPRTRRGGGGTTPSTSAEDGSDAFSTDSAQRSQSGHDAVSDDADQAPTASFDDVGQAELPADSAPAPVLTRWYYDAGDGYPLDIRSVPGIDVQRTRMRLYPGDVFEVRMICAAGDVLLLELADGRGWVFDRKPGVGQLCWPLPHDGGCQQQSRSDGVGKCASATGAGGHVNRSHSARRMLATERTV